MSCSSDEGGSFMCILIWNFYMFLISKLININKIDSSFILDRTIIQKQSEIYYCLNLFDIIKNKKNILDIKSIIVDCFKIKNFNFRNDYSYCFIKKDNILITYCNLIYLKNKNAIYLCNLCTDPNYRRSGFSIKLINFIFYNIIPSGKYLLLVVDISNAPAISLYKKLNFEFVSIIEKKKKILCKKKKK